MMNPSLRGTLLDRRFRGPAARPGVFTVYSLDDLRWCLQNRSDLAEVQCTIITLHETMYTDGATPSAGLPHYAYRLEEEQEIAAISGELNQHGFTVVGYLNGPRWNRARLGVTDAIRMCMHYGWWGGLYGDNFQLSSQNETDYLVRSLRRLYPRETGGILIEHATYEPHAGLTKQPVWRASWTDVLDFAVLREGMLEPAADPTTWWWEVSAALSMGCIGLPKFQMSPTMPTDQFERMIRSLPNWYCSVRSSIRSTIYGRGWWMWYRDVWYPAYRSMVQP